MMRYSKRKVETQAGLEEGVSYFEFDGRIPTRQVERYGDRWFDSRSSALGLNRLQDGSYRIPK